MTEIKVVVDESVSVNLSIPTEIKLGELESLLENVKRLKTGKRAGRPKTQQVVKRKQRRRKGHQVALPKDQAARNALVREWDSATKTRKNSIAKRFNTSYRHMQKTIYYLKNQDKWTKKQSGRNVLPKDKELRVALIRTWETASREERESIAKKYSTDIDGMHKKVYYLKTHG